MIGRFLKGRKAWKHRGTDGTEIQKGRKAWKHGGTRGHGVTCSPSPPSSLPVFSHRLFSHRLFSHRLFSHRLFSHRLFSHRLFSHRLFSSRLFSHRLFSLRLFSHRLFSLRLFSLRALWASVFQKKVQRVCERVRARVWSIRVSPARLAQGLLRVPVCSKLRAMRRLGCRLGPWRLQARSRASLPRRR